MSITICLFLSNNCICSIWLVQLTTTLSYGNESHASFLISFLENKKAQKPYDIWVFGVGIQIGCITWLHRWDFCRLRLLPSPVAWSKRVQSAASHPFLPALWGIAARKRYSIVLFATTSGLSLRARSPSRVHLQLAANIHAFGRHRKRKTILNRFSFTNPTSYARRIAIEDCEFKSQLRNQRKKAPCWVPLRWLRRWDLNLTTSGL